MGYMTELNTLVRVPKDFDVLQFKTGATFTIVREKERTFPLHIAMLLIDTDWKFYGYCVVNEAIIKDNTTTLTFTILTLFSPEEQTLYKQKFLEAAKLTDEVS